MNSNLARQISRNISNFSVIGSGLMGAGIAQVGAQTGHQGSWENFWKKLEKKSKKVFWKFLTMKKVVLYDISDAALDKAKVSIEKSVARVAKKMEAEKAEQFIAETLG